MERVPGGWDRSSFELWPTGTGSVPDGGSVRQRGSDLAHTGSWTGGRSSHEWEHSDGYRRPTIVPDDDWALGPLLQGGQTEGQGSAPIYWRPLCRELLLSLGTAGPNPGNTYP